MNKEKDNSQQNVSNESKDSVSLDNLTSILDKLEAEIDSMKTDETEESIEITEESSPEPETPTEEEHSEKLEEKNSSEEKVEPESSEESKTSEDTKDLTSTPNSSGLFIRETSKESERSTSTNASKGESIFAADALHNDSNSTIDVDFLTPKETTPEVVVDHKSRNKKLLIAGAIVLALLLGIYIWGVINYQNKFLPNTYLAGYSIANKTLDDSLEVLDTISSDRIVNIVGRDGVESEVKASDVGLVLNESPDIAQTLSEQNSWAWPLSLMGAEETNIASDSSMNEEALNQVISTLPVVSGEQVVKTENAQAAFDGNAFVLQEEVYGTEVNFDELKNEVVDSLLNGTDTIELEEASIYVEPTILSDNQTLIESIDRLNAVKDSVITINFDIAQEILDKNTFAPWLLTDEAGNVAIDQEQVNAYVAALADKYDTYDKPAPFTTSYGDQIEFTDWYNCWEINQEQEAADLANLILSGQTVTKDPDYLTTGRPRTENNAVTDTYLEISIGGQHMWYYENGELIVSTPVVTGDTSSGHGTPTGLFCIQNKETDVVLTDNATYWSPVTFWMPFSGPEGVHDATWRSSFGGSIYRGNGSHGCVNTPYSAARTIFNNIEVGAPVAIYY